MIRRPGKMPIGERSNSAALAPQDDGGFRPSVPRAPRGDLEQRYRTLLAVGQATVTHRDFETLFRCLASKLRQVVPVDFLARGHILGVLRQTGWVVGGPEGAAARLGIKRSTLQRKLKRLGISRPHSARPWAGLPARGHSAAGTSAPSSRAP